MKKYIFSTEHDSFKEHVYSMCNFWVTIDNSMKRYTLNKYVFVTSASVFIMLAQTQIQYQTVRKTC